MVGCSPGPEGAVASSGIDEIGNDQSILGFQEPDSNSSNPAQQFREPPQTEAQYPSSVAPLIELSKGICLSTTPIRSSSDSNLYAAVSPLPSTSDVRQVAKDEITNPGLKHDGVLAVDPGIHEYAGSRQRTEESDTFLNASMQLMHLNGEARQRVRQLWTSVQRLGRENQISEAGMDLLYMELTTILKSMSAEKLEASKHLHSGHLILLASSPASDPVMVSGGAAVKTLFGARPTAQLMQCSVSETQSKLEMTPIRQTPAPVNSTNAGTPLTPSTSTLGRFALPSTASLMGMISDAFQEEPTTRIIKLQGCQVRRLVPKSPSNEATSGDVSAHSELPRRAKMFHRFQLLVPNKTQMSDPSDGVRADVLFPTKTPVPYESFIFEVPTLTTEAEWTEANVDAQAQVDDWVWALDRVCRFQLHRLEHALREAPTIERYRETLQHHFPVCVPLSWLRNRVDQPNLFQRRASVNLSMIQIVKDLGRDKVLLDGHLFSAVNPFEDDDKNVDSVSEVVKYMVKEVLKFEQEASSQHRVPGKTGASAVPSHQPSSPAHRFAKNCEAQALAFVERVLQGSSRTQSGGDIYDAISFFCQQDHVSICPFSQDARPVQMQITADVAKGGFQVEVQVCMKFKVIELTPRSPTPASPNEHQVSSFGHNSMATDSPRESLLEWAVLEGTLSRQFTLGQLSAPGTVTIKYISPEMELS